MPPENNDTHNAVMAHKVDAVHSRLIGLESSMNKLTDAIVKLALIEERQSQFAITQERAFKVLEKIDAKVEGIEKRVVDLEVAEPMQKQTSSWILAAVWGFAGLMAASLIHKLTGLFQ